MKKTGQNHQVEKNYASIFDRMITEMKTLTQEEYAMDSLYETVVQRGM